MRRRALVLTSESARHPFRQTLPPHVLSVPKPAKDEDQDFKLFVLSFAAFFTVFYSFIA